MTIAFVYFLGLAITYIGRPVLFLASKPICRELRAVEMKWEFKENHSFGKDGSERPGCTF